MEKEQNLLRYLVRDKEQIKGWRAQFEITTHIETTDSKDWLVIRSQDNGMGKALEELPEKNWIKYHRTKSIAESLGGRFEYEAKKGEGAIATAWFPIVKKVINGETCFVIAPHKD